MLTVAICTYRRFDWLEKCLESFKKQSLPANQWRVIVVDNSLLEDESKTFRKSLQYDHTPLTYIIAKKSGLSHARNIALENCKTPIIAFIDDDAIPDADWAEMVLNAFSQYPAAGVIGGKVLPLWESKPPIWLSGKLRHCLAILDWGEEDVFVDGSKWLVGANIAYRADALRKCGGFDNNLGRKNSLLLAHEELSTNICIQSMGYDIIYSPSFAVSHFIQKERVTKDWLLKDAMWEGVSRTIYEHDIAYIDTKQLAERVESALQVFKRECRPPDVAEEIDKARNQYRYAGRNTCLETIGPCSKKRHDFYFTNIVSVVYIVTPCLNAAGTIDQTIHSVFSQAGSFAIRYHVQDGGSTDGTLDKLKKWKSLLESNHFPTDCKHIVFTFDSSPDSGMYDAIAKGFATMCIPPEAFMTWVNADDILMPGTLSLLHDAAMLFARQQISWLTGAAMIIKNNRPLYQYERSYSSEIIMQGCCDGKHWYFMQQEGTFFRNWLWEKVDAANETRKYKYAGDWHLWRLFARHAPPVAVLFPLGAFRIREGQLSQIHNEKYEKEIENTINLEERRESFKKLVEKTTLTQRQLKMSYPEGNFVLVEKGISGLAYHHYHSRFGRWPEKPFDGSEDNKEKVIFDPEDLTLADKPEKRHRHKTVIPADQSLIIENSGSFSTNGINRPLCINVVTPCLNAAKTVDYTIQSVIGQSGEFFIRYHVQDGGSEDGTTKKLKQWEDKLSRPNSLLNCLGITFSWCSEPDDGIYDAIIKGFDVMNIATDDFMTWINGDDIFLTGALDTVVRIGRELPDVLWIGSPTCVIDQGGKIMSSKPNPTPTAVLREGLCDGKDRHWRHLQQEGTFFKKRLWFRSRHASNGFTLAGDWALWREMARNTEYYQYEKPLGAFRRHKGQLSNVNRGQYEKEIENELPIHKRLEAFERFYAARYQLYANIIKQSTPGGKIHVQKENKAVLDIFENTWQKNKNFEIR